MANFHQTKIVEAPDRSQIQLRSIILQSLSNENYYSSKFEYVSCDTYLILDPVFKLFVGRNFLISESEIKVI